MLDDIYKIRLQLEDGDINSSGGIANFFRQQDLKVYTRLNAPEDYQKFRPRIELKCAIGAATGRRHFCSDQKLRYDAFNFTLGLQAVTAPNPTPAQNELHEDYVARIRNNASSLGGEATFLDMVNFPGVYIAEPLKDAGIADTLKTNEGVEYSTLSYSGIVCIRHSAWSV